MKTNEEAVCLAVLFFYVLTRHTNTLTDKGFNVFDGCASRCVNHSPQEEGVAGRRMQLFFLRGQ